MFSRRSLFIIGALLFLIVNLIALSLAGGRYSAAPGKIIMSVIAPFQEITFQSIRFSKNLWRHYFFLVSIARENDELKRDLRAALEKNKDQIEVELSNLRMRKLLNFQNRMNFEMVACEVIAKDPSAVFKTLIIDKGESDGLKAGMPVVVPEGIVGQIIQTANHYAKVLLVVDRNNAVDAILQRTRARGILKGELGDICRLEYVLRKDDVQIGDVVVSSGSDGVFPKGFRLGSVSDVARQQSGIFYEVIVTPSVNFEKLEEVLVLLNPQVEAFTAEQ